MYCGYIIGGIVAVIGLVNVICYFAKKMVDGVYRSEFVVGIIAIAAGAYVALLSGGTLSFILLVLGLLCAVDGLLKIQYTLDLARMHYEKWWLPLIMGALGLGIGVIIVMGLLADLAGSSVNNQLMYLGATFCLNCVLDVITIVVIAVRNSKAAHEVVHDAATSETFTSESESAARPVSPQPNLQPVPPQPIPQPVPPQPAPQPVPPQPAPPARCRRSQYPSRCRRSLKSNQCRRSLKSNRCRRSLQPNQRSLLPCRTLRRRFLSARKRRLSCKKNKFMAIRRPAGGLFA